MEQKRFKISKWIFLSLSILFNAFIVVYSCLPSKVTEDWNLAFTNIFTNIVNTFSPKNVETIPLTKLDIGISSDKYNFIPGYQDNAIPLGSAKQISFTYEPSNATNKSVEYYTENTDVVKLNQSGEKLSVIGLKEGTATIFAKNELSGLTSSCEVLVVKTIAPTSFEISVADTNVSLNSYADIVIDIDGGPLEHNELHNSRYYDIRKLQYTSSNESVLTINEYGVIHPVSTGSSTISVSNGIITKELPITVVDGSPISPYSNLKIAGSNIAYDSDYIYDKHGSKLSIFDGETELTNESFLWTSSNELLVNVDRHGVVRGFRKISVEDQKAVITATSKITGQTATFEVIVKDQLPTKLAYSIEAYGGVKWNTDIFTTCVGDEVIIKFYLEPVAYNKQMTVTSSDAEIINPVFQGGYANLEIKKEGKCVISFSYDLDPTLKGSIEFTVLKAGAMNTGDITEANFTLRKVVGHAALFMVTQIFTIIALYMFFDKKKMWFYCVISVGIGLFFASLSETIEYFVPTRSGKFLDVLIDFAGVVVGAALFIGFMLLYKYIKSKKNKNDL